MLPESFEWLLKLNGVLIVKQENDFNNRSSGYQPMSYEEAVSVRNSRFDREPLRDGTRPYNPFTKLGDRPKLRKVGIILTSIGVFLILLTTIIFSTAKGGDYKILSMMRIEGVVDSFSYVSDDESKSNYVNLKYTYNGDTYTEKVRLGDSASVGDTVTVYLNKHDPTDITDPAYMPLRLNDTKKNYYFFGVLPFIAGVLSIAYSYEHIRLQSAETVARSNEAKNRFIRHQ